MPHLWSPVRLPCGLILQNRIGKPAMTEGLADPTTHAANAQHVELYRRWSETRVGLLITGNIMVDSRYKECPGNIAIEDESFLPLLTEMATQSQATGCALFAQISHAGRQSPISVTAEPISISTLPPVKAILPVFGASRACTTAELDDIVKRFARAAAILDKAGFKGAQIHAAHGYLLSQSLSPLLNQRTDQYGGTLEKRMLLLRRVIRAVRAAVSPSFAVAVKLNSSDFQRHGFTHEESYIVVRMLDAEGVDLLEVSGGNYENPKMMSAVVNRQSTREREAFFMEYCDGLPKDLRMRVMLTGGFRSAVAMEAAIVSGSIHLCGVARPFCVEPQVIQSLTEESCLAAKVQLRDVPLGIPGVPGFDAALQNLWHQAQIQRLAQGKDVDMYIGYMKLLTWTTFKTYIVEPRTAGWKSYAVLSLLIGIGSSIFLKR